MFLRRAASAGLATTMAAALASAPTVADSIVLNLDFVINDAVANQASNIGQFFLQSWLPSGYASSSNADPGQFDNGMVQGFVAGQTYRISVGANARAQPQTKPTFTISTDNQQVLAPTTLTLVGPVNIFSMAFMPIQSDTFVAATASVKITFADISTSDSTASTLLTTASVFQVPEPVSLAILGIGLICIGIARRRSHA